MGRGPCRPSSLPLEGRVRGQKRPRAPGQSWASCGFRRALGPAFLNSPSPWAPCHPRSRPSALPNFDEPPRSRAQGGGAIGSEKGVLETGPQDVHLPGLWGPGNPRDEGPGGMGSHSQLSSLRGRAIVGFLYHNSPGRQKPSGHRPRSHGEEGLPAVV